MLSQISENLSQNYLDFLKKRSLSFRYSLSLVTVTLILVIEDDANVQDDGNDPEAKCIAYGI